MYSVKEIFYTLQGEGPNTGRAAVFVRFAGCNKWDGREETRANSACPFCDSEFRAEGAMKFGDLEGIFSYICNMVLPHALSTKDVGVVLTGGEPTLQLRKHSLINRFAQCFGWVDIETNGSVPFTEDEPLLETVTIICSPKDKNIVIHPHLFKVLFPDKKHLLAVIAERKLLHVKHTSRVIWLQPVDGPNYQQNLDDALLLIQACPWTYRLSVQVHKVTGLR